MVKRDVYTHGHQPAAVNQHAKRTAATSAAFCRDVISSTSQILDVGCGPASISIGLAEWADQGFVTAIDLGEQILETANETIRNAGISNITVEQASVYELPYEDQSFDVTYAHQVLQHLAGLGEVQLAAFAQPHVRDAVRRGRLRLAFVGSGSPDARGDAVTRGEDEPGTLTDEARGSGGGGLGEGRVCAGGHEARAAADGAALGYC